MIRLENLSKYYTSSKQVVLGLRNINLEFQAGEFVVITGVSGSGKSTLLNVISGLDTYEQGKMFVNGVDFSHFNIDELEQYRAGNISFIFQSFHIIDSFTVKQNIELPLIYRGISKNEREETVNELLEKVGMTKHRKVRVSKLSGGEKQRVAIARAIAKDAPVIVADEPTGNLDKDTSKNIYKLLKEVSENKLVIVVTHDEKEIIEHASRTIRLFDGEVVEDKTTEEKKANSTELHEYNSSWFEVFKLSIKSVFAKPKKLSFTIVFLSFLYLLLVIVQGINLTTLNLPSGSESRYFPNNDVNRLIVTKYGEPISESELIELYNYENVVSVLENDAILDSELVFKTYDEMYFKDTYIYFNIYSIDMLNTSLLEGRLPTNSNEVVTYQSSHFNLGEKISVSHSSFSAEKEGVETDQYNLRVVGILATDSLESTRNDLFFTNEGLMELNETVIYERSDIYILVQDLRKGLVHDIRIDNELEDNIVRAFPTMFYDVMVELEYIVYETGDLEYLHVEEEALQRLLDENTFYIQANTPYEVASEPYEVTFITKEQEPHPLGGGIYMNDATYNELFNDAIYQVSLILDGKVEVSELRSDIESSGYNTFYPAKIQTMDSVLSELLLKLKTAANFLLVLLIVYSTGYFVFKNIMDSNSYDYHVHRMIGASHKKLRQLMVYEQWNILTIATLLSITIIFIVKHYYHYSFLRYITYKEYIITYIVLGVLITILTVLSQNRMFKKSILASFKDEVRL